jgi:hypothetical protein
VQEDTLIRLADLQSVTNLAHTAAYLGERQPWRTITFVVGGLVTLVMVGFLVRMMAAAV